MSLNFWSTKPRSFFIANRSNAVTEIGTQRLLDFWSRIFFVKFFMSALIHFVICCFQTDKFNDFVKFWSNENEPETFETEMIFVIFWRTWSMSVKSLTPQFLKKLKMTKKKYKPWWYCRFFSVLARQSARNSETSLFSNRKIKTRNIHYYQGLTNHQVDIVL